MPVLQIDELTQLAARALAMAGASRGAALAAARALVAAEGQGLGSHGVSRIPQYAAFLRNGRSNPQAVPAIVRSKGGVCFIHAESGMAYEACALAIDTAQARALVSLGVSCVGVTNSNHFGAAALHLNRWARPGWLGWHCAIRRRRCRPGWRAPLFGTNPVAAVFPRRDAAPLLIDLALSEVARGKLMVAAKSGKPIPLGWALDKAGQPTTDARAALAGIMLPVGGLKGRDAGARRRVAGLRADWRGFGFEADCFFVDAGNRPRLGQMFIAVDPAAAAGAAMYFSPPRALDRNEMQDDGVRLPGARRARFWDRLGSTESRSRTAGWRACGTSGRYIELRRRKACSHLFLNYRKPNNEISITVRVAATGRVI